MSNDDLYVPDSIKKWAAARARHRADKNWAQADELRDRIAATGYVVKDAADGFDIERPTIDSPDDVPSHIEEDDTCRWSVVIIARDRDEDLTRTVQSVLRHGQNHDLEAILVGNGQAPTHDAMADLAVEHPQVRPIYTSQMLGEGASLAVGLRAAQGQYVLVLGVHVELTGDPFGPLEETLSDETIGVTGGWGVTTHDIFTWESSDGPEVDAVESYLFAFRRQLLHEVGLPDQRFQFYRNLDLDWSLAFKDKGYRLVLTPDLPTQTHEHIWQRTDPEEGERMSRKNYRRLLDKWRDRTDLLVSSGDQPSS